ncbi:MAG: CsgG/HfaB family protein [Planctomycetota bacterium]
MQSSTGVRKTGLLIAIAAFATLGVAGCASSSESAERDKLTAHVGIYDPPPPGITKPRVGVPAIEMKGEGASADLSRIAAEQLTTLAFQTGRFNTIERAQLEQLVKEQGYEGMVRADEIAKVGKIRGVDLLFFGTVTNLRVKQEKTKSTFGLAQLPLIGNSVGAVDYSKANAKIVAECGVDIRLVDPSTGEIFAATSSEFKRIDSVDAMGLSLLGVSSKGEADVEISDDNRGKILRLALDEAMRKILPQVDPKLAAQAQAAAASGAPSATGTPPAGTSETAKHCTGCGAKLAEGKPFCAGCGAKTGG